MLHFDFYATFFVLRGYSVFLVQQLSTIMFKKYKIYEEARKLCKQIVALKLSLVIYRNFIVIFIVKKNVSRINRRVPKNVQRTLLKK